MKNCVIITEICSAGTQTASLDYDLLPVKVKTAVDEALISPDHSVEKNIYEYGIQALPDKNKLFIGNEQCNLIGTVQIYHPE